MYRLWLIPVLAAASLLMNTELAHSQTREGQCQSAAVEAQGGTIHGRLCIPPDGTARGLQVLVHGATYTGEYWTGLDRFQSLSYVRQAVRGGFATFSYDRLGAGSSSVPPGLQLTVADAAATLRVVVDHYSRRFRDITVVGHSLGSIITVRWAAVYGNADRIVVTGLRYPLVGLPVAALPELARAIFVPAATDERLRKHGYGPVSGYLTTRPGLRGDLFYSATAHPDVIAYDEATKSVVSVAQLAGFIARDFTLDQPTDNVEMPVLVVMGGQDTLFCSLLTPCTEQAVQNRAEQNYSSAPIVDSFVVPRTGHNLALHPSSPDTTQRIGTWIRQHA